MQNKTLILYLCYTLCITLLCCCQHVNAQSQPQNYTDEYGFWYIAVKITEDNVHNYTVNLDQYCKDGPNGTRGYAVRVINEEIVDTLYNISYNSNVQLLVGARLMPQYDQGWYWAGKDWNDSVGLEFLSSYWNNATWLLTETMKEFWFDLPNYRHPEAYLFGSQPLIEFSVNTTGFYLTQAYGEKKFIACTTQDPNDYVNFSVLPVKHDNATKPGSCDYIIYSYNNTLHWNDFYYQTELFVTIVSLWEMQAIWDNGGMDTLCQRAKPDVENVGAFRILSDDNLTALHNYCEDNNLPSTLYVSARLYPNLCQGWFWPGINGTEDGAMLMHDTYTYVGNYVFNGKFLSEYGAYDIFFDLIYGNSPLLQFEWNNKKFESQQFVNIKNAQIPCAINIAKFNTSTTTTITITTTNPNHNNINDGCFYDEYNEYICVPSATPSSLTTTTTTPAPTTTTTTTPAPTTTTTTTPAPTTTTTTTPAPTTTTTTTPAPTTTTTTTPAPPTTTITTPAPPTTTITTPAPPTTTITTLAPDAKKGSQDNFIKNNGLYIIIFVLLLIVLIFGVVIAILACKLAKYAKSCNARQHLQNTTTQ